MSINIRSILCIMVIIFIHHQFVSFIFHKQGYVNLNNADTVCLSILLLLELGTWKMIRDNSHWRVLQRILQRKIYDRMNSLAVISIFIFIVAFKTFSSMIDKYYCTSGFSSLSKQVSYQSIIKTRWPNK